MKNTFKLTILLISIVYSLNSYSQEKIFYKNYQGDILDEKAYNTLKDETLKKIQRAVKSMKLYEELAEEYTSSDSMLYSYTWHFTDNLKKTEKSIQKEKLRDEHIIGEIYPIHDAKTLNGKTLSIEDFKGKPTLINLWFTACAPCIAEMPALNKMKAENSDEYNFLAITFDSEAKVKKLLQRFNFDFEQIVNSKDLTSKMGFESYPKNLFLDKNGILRVIKGNVPYSSDVNGDDVYHIEDFLNILENL